MASRYGGRFLSANAPNPAKEPVPVYERRWVLPYPTARIKVLKWVKADHRPSRTFPDEEDARYIYASSSSHPSTSTTIPTGALTGSLDAKSALSSAPTSLLTGTNAANAPPEGEDVVMNDAAAQIKEDIGSEEILNAQEETQGQHLFDETQVDPILPTPLGDDTSTPAGDISMTPAMAVKIGEAVAADQGGKPEGARVEAEAEGEEVEEDAEVDDDVAEEEEEVSDLPKRHQTIRIGGPLPEDKRVPKATVTFSEPTPEVVVAKEEEGQQEIQMPAVPTPQVDSELHPPPDGVPPSDPLVEEQARQEGEETSAPAIIADSSLNAIETDPASAVDTGDLQGEADNLGGIEVVSKDDPEVKGLGDDIAAIVHAQPDGVEKVKVVEQD